MKHFIKIISFLAFALILITYSEQKVSAAQTTDTFGEVENGIVTIRYNNSTDAKMKIGVSKDNQSYYYDLGNGENELNIPLNMGNGKYTLKILKNISGTKYSVVQSTNIELELTDEKIVFLQSNVIVNFDLEDKAIQKAASLTKKCKSEAEIISTIYNYVVKNFSYDFDKINSLSSGYIPDIEIVYKSKKGICYDISAIMASMLRSQGVEVKLVTGYTPNIEGVYHAWNSVYDAKSKKWITIDATYDIAMYKANKSYKMKKSIADYSDIKYQY